MRNRFLLGVVAVVVVFATACLPADWRQGYETSDPAPADYPAGGTYDWFWVGLTPETVDYLIDAVSPGSYLQTQVCMPETSVSRMYLVSAHEGGYYYAWTSNSACTAWVTLGSAPNNSWGWQKMSTMGGGESFTVRFRSNSAQGQTLYSLAEFTFEAQVASTSGQVWYSFPHPDFDGAEPQLIPPSVAARAEFVIGNGPPLKME